MGYKFKDEDIIGTRYGKLVAIEPAGIRYQPNGDKLRLFKCKCDCGNEIIATLGHLRSGHTTSCGCARPGYETRKDHSRFIGQKFGRLTVIEQAPDIVQENGRRRLAYLCRCECGNEKVVSLDHLLGGDTTSCGCYAKEIASERYLDNLIGQRFGKLVVIGRAPNRCIDRTYWLCQCDCGNKKEVFTQHLKTGITVDCGCGSEKSSYPERRIAKYLRQIGYDFRTEYTFQDLKYRKSLRFDFAIFRDGQLLCLIEYQGPQHYSDKLDWKYDARLT